MAIIRFVAALQLVLTVLEEIQGRHLLPWPATHTQSVALALGVGFLITELKAGWFIMIAASIRDRTCSRHAIVASPLSTTWRLDRQATHRRPPRARGT